MTVNLETTTYDQFSWSIVKMPTSWLLHYYKLLHHDNESYHLMIEDEIESDDMMLADEIVDRQVECFNRMLAIGNVLTFRNVSLPYFEIENDFI